MSKPQNQTQTLATKNAPKSEDAPTEEQIRMAAYLNWERQTGGAVVDDDATRSFWLEAEQQVADPDKSETNGDS